MASDKVENKGHRIFIVLTFFVLIFLSNIPLSFGASVRIGRKTKYQINNV